MHGTYDRAGAAATDHREDYRPEIGDGMQKAIARAWTDDAFKQELIADPHRAFADLGVHFPDHVNLEFYDDPSAQPGDWSSIGKGDGLVMRVPIPPAPGDGALSAEDLEGVSGGAACCCFTCCSCTGTALSLREELETGGQDSAWY